MKATIKRTVIGLALVARVVAAGGGTGGAHARTVTVAAHQQADRAKITPAMLRRAGQRQRTHQPTGRGASRHPPV